MKIVILGLSITSSWGNGHATTYRGLVRALVESGHEVLFLERDVPWYAANRDLPNPPYGRTRLYHDLDELRDTYASEVRSANAVIVGSYVTDGIDVGNWVCATARGAKAFYDIDTPVTLAALQRGDCAYLSAALISQYDLYLSFTGGVTLDYLQHYYGAPMVRALYCSFDPELYFPEERLLSWDLGYMGTYSDDRQPTLNSLLIEPASQCELLRCVVAGPQYPENIVWPENVQRIQHLAPPQHQAFYTSQRFTLNITRSDMRRTGYAPSVRLFEAAACATPIISDWWEGLDTLFTPGKEILIAEDASDTLRYLETIDEDERRQIGERARQRVLANHSAAHRAVELESYLLIAQTLRSPI